MIVRGVGIKASEQIKHRSHRIERDGDPFLRHVRVTCVSEVTLDSEDVDEAALCILVLAHALRSLC